MPEVIHGKATIHEKLLRPLSTEVDWRVQRRMWGRYEIAFCMSPNEMTSHCIDRFDFEVGNATLEPMSTQLIPEQSTALQSSADHRLVVVDPATNREYALVSTSEFEENRSIEAISRGIAQMEAGKGKPLSEAMNDIRNQLKQHSYCYRF